MPSLDKDPLPSFCFRAASAVFSIFRWRRHGAGFWKFVILERKSLSSFLVSIYSDLMLMILFEINVI